LVKAIRDTTKEGETRGTKRSLSHLPSEYTHPSDNRKVKEARAFLKRLREELDTHVSTTHQNNGKKKEKKGINDDDDDV